MYLWRAIDQNGEVLDILVQARRDKRAALKLMRKLFKKHGFAPRTLVTDKWRAYGAAFRELGLTAWHHQAKWKNNRIEGSHVRVRRRERAMQAFRSPGSANASSQSTPPSIITSPPDDISYQLSSIVTVAIKLSQRGALPPAPLPDGMLRWA